VKKPLKTSSKTAVKKSAASSSAKSKVSVPAKKASKPAPAKTPPKKAAPKPQAVVKKVASKSTPKTVKPSAKSAAKPVAKSSPKHTSKPANKPVTKTASKPPVKAKPASKAVNKLATKLATKPVAKSAPKPSAKAATKPVVKPAVKTVVKAPVKPTAKAAVKTVKPEKLALPVALPVIAPAPPGDVPARAVRPSARLAQITVPSMAQSVASTAAKASYLQNTPSQALTPPPFVAVKKDSKLANNWKTKKPDQLKDAEIMAMSDNEYMNDAQMAFFRLKLVELKQGILANAGETTEHLREDTVVVPDPADRATIEEEHALELRTRDRERKLLKKIEQSIQRIDAGDYGYCDETGEPIGVGRLLARPTANLSLEAQQRRELKQKMFGD
jgi:DnaK suppressor protein